MTKDHSVMEVVEVTETSVVGHWGMGRSNGVQTVRICTLPKNSICWLILAYVNLQFGS